MRTRKTLCTLAALSLLMLGGCSSKSYVTPDQGVSLTGIDDADIEQLFSKKPASPFPAQLSIVRVASGYNDGFEVVQTRDIESDADLARIAEQPLISQAAPLSRLLTPNGMKSLRDLRLPAAHMRSDLLLVYTVDTKFYVDSTPLGPLTAVSLGFLPNHQAHVTATVAGILVDVRSGYIYGSTEATAQEEQRSSTWSTEDAVAESKNRAEKAAFSRFSEGFPAFWKGVVAKYAKSAPEATAE
ncbi:hypothetical protein ACSC9U_28235 [Pseudomonas solani]|uniref:hypothetical protein n=1 Tax=Pseudomonas solani TaxID=2731552 RepID=UPI003F4AE291